MDLNLPYPRLDAATVGVLKPQPHTRACQLPAETGSGRRGSMQGVRAAEEDANHHRQQEEPAPRASQGRSRTRFHPEVKHAAIPRRKANAALRSSPPVVNHTALRTSSPDARTTSRLVRSVSGTPFCHEQPRYWSTGSGFDPLRHVLHSEKETIHSRPVAPCSQTEAHAIAPFYVCATCRVAARKHRAKHFGNLGRHPRSLPLCDECASENLNTMGDPEHVDIRRLKRYGCTCKTDWMCFECSLRDVKNARVHYDVELEVRQGLTDVEDLDGVQNVWIRVYCICGKRLDGKERAYRCTCCHGIAII